MSVTVCSGASSAIDRGEVFDEIRLIVEMEASKARQGLSPAEEMIATVDDRYPKFVHARSFKIDIESCCGSRWS